jgi:hypothetical protein
VNSYAYSAFIFSKQNSNRMASATGGVGGADPDVMEAIGRGNAVVFFDVELGEGANAASLGRVKLELFVKDVRSITLQPDMNSTGPRESHTEK